MRESVSEHGAWNVRAFQSARGPQLSMKQAANSELCKIQRECGAPPLSISAQEDRPGSH